MGTAKRSAILAAALLAAGANGAFAAEPAKSKAEYGQSASKGGEQGVAKKGDPSVALKAYDTGAKAYEAGKFNEAVTSLSAALANGGLPSQQMAKALYYRGAAYRKQGKPAQAISDLTTAVWMKGGLSDTDRAQALDERKTAYQEAGLGDTPPAIGQAPLDAPAKTAAAASAQAPAAAPVPSKPGATLTQVTPQSGIGSFFSSLIPSSLTSSSPVPSAPAPVAETAATAGQAAPAPVAAAPVAVATSSVPSPFDVPAGPAPKAVAQQAQEVAAFAPAAVSVSGSPAAPAAADVPAFQTQTTGASAAAMAPAPAPPASAPAAQVSFAEPAAAPAAPAPALSALPPDAPAEPSTGPSPLAQAGEAVSNAGKSVGSFFGNLFKGNGAGETATQTPSSPVATSSTGPSTAVSSWNGSTEVEAASSANKAKAPKPVTAAAPAQAPAPGVQPSGRYRLQVAAVRSREEANQLAAGLKQKHMAMLGAAEPVVDEAVIGNFGTFYRVRVGPYADAKVPGQMCSSLRPHGYDCLVVSQ